ncbi:hypothetical protein NGM10_13400 [Halorussus salilacus]|uniref:hypothetical protein n=1 Tax=Halorussus salilacus TaxID=2953750 RepID=UPI00209DBD34|nr:hypothetical protein [Halorussus salilacus]USZ67717.1 hypothetical protein NGM10_13400 [Halorussus salilacus]
MSTCHNCGHAGTFVLLVEFALAVRDGSPNPDSTDSDRPDRGDSTHAGRSTRREWSLSVQCPACDSTDVGVAATDLLAGQGSSTTS